jgi:hypothetical protein
VRPHALPALLLLVSAAAAEPSPTAPAQDRPDPLQQALAALRIDARDVTLLGPGFTRQLPPAAASALSTPLRAPYLAGISQQMAARDIDSVHRLLLYTSAQSGNEIALGALGNPLRETDRIMAEAPDPLALALRGLGGAEPPSADVLPPPWRHEIARLLFAITAAEAHRKRAFRRTELPALGTLKRHALHLVLEDGEEGFEFHDALRSTDRNALAAGGLLLAAAMEDFAAVAKDLPALPEPVWFATSMGPVMIDTEPVSRGISAVNDGPPLLYIRTGGDDVHTYLEPPDDGSRPIQLALDLGGNDRHTANATGALAGGFAGYSFVWDMAGDDGYYAFAGGLGSGVLGIGVLVDESGADSYLGQLGVQAHAIGGVGLLLDRGGDDHYAALTESQGCAGPFGAALLMDVAGDDRYDMTDTPLIRPAAQAPGRNSSMGQGAGMGERRDLTSGDSLSGGVGMLYDLAGNDEYRASVYAQGAGYFGGYGLLVDDSGDDRYTGAYYVQGAAAHRAVGGLIDRGGDDRYSCEIQVSHGGGHDYSLGFLADADGSDEYAARDFALGGAFENGIGLFIDVRGKDRYTVPRGRTNSLGASEILHWGTPRESTLGLGLFFDLGGKDTYEAIRPEAGDGRTWMLAPQFPDIAPRGELGFGTDGEYASPFPLGALTPASNHERRTRREAIESRRAWRKQRAGS